MIEIDTKIKNMGCYAIQYINCVAKESIGEHGLSHLVEHCMCEPIKKYDKKFRQNGISWNAYTGQEQLVFLMTGLCKNIRKYINKFTYDILTYQITPQVFERERKIVIAEYKQYYSEDIQRFNLNWLRKHYNSTEVLGLITDLQNITYQKFIQFKNKIINAHKQIYFIRNKTKNRFQFDQKTNNILNYSAEQKQHLDFQFQQMKYQNYPIEKYTTGQNNVKTIFLWHKIDYKNNPAKQIALSKLMGDYLAGGLSSYLYKEIREKLGCVYSIQYSISQLKKQGYILFILQTDKQHLQLVFHELTFAIKKLFKKIFKKEFNSIYKARITKTNINKNTNYTDFNSLIDPQLIEIDKYLSNKIITFDQFKQFMIQFTIHYRLFYSDHY